MSPARIKQRFDDYNRALKRLEEVLKEDVRLSSAILDGAIQRFEFTFELSWKLMQAVLEFRGIQATSPRAVIKEAFQQRLITDGTEWVSMLEDRNKATHTYDEPEARRIYDAIGKRYFKLLSQLHDVVVKDMGEL